jgi:glycosyltransferase 2 family protein
VLSGGQRRLLSWAGGAAGALGIAFIVIKLVELRQELALTSLGTRSWLVVIGLTISSGLSGTLLALAWRELLTHLGEPVRRAWAVRVYGTTQLAKYVPGNVVHLAARQAIGAAAALRGAPLAKATVWEFGIFAGTGSTFFLLTLPLIVTAPIAVGLSAFALVVGLCIWTAYNYVSASLAQTIAFHCVYFLIAGLLFVSVLALFDLKVTTFALPICGAYVLASIAGLVTPGTPAGFGVREAALYALLHSLIDQSSLFSASLLSRVMTMGGDLFFFFYAILVPAKTPRSDI